MLTGDIRSKVDKIWETFWTGGISNPLTIIEQISYLLFIKRIDDNQLLEEKKAQRLGTALENPTFPEDKQHLRWSRFRDNEPQAMFDLFHKEVFPFLKNELSKSATSTFAKTMADANFLIPKASLLAQAVDMVEQIPMEDRDTKGDVYEYMLGKIATAGTNGQFRTPRHIIKMMVELMKPTSDMKVCDPACGTAGFLTSTCEYLISNDENYYNTTTDIFHGYDFDTTMLRIGSMNMMMHGVENPIIEYKDSLSETNEEKEVYDLILANPPFKGSLAEDEVAPDLLATVETKKTELLFLALMLRLLKFGGRAAVIVPDGVLFGSSKAHNGIRKEIVENQYLEAVISMPSGVFKPYAGVSTAILIFTKTGSGGTDNVWFYDMKSDGYSLDDKRTKLEESDIPDIVKRFHNQNDEKDNKRTEQSFLVPKDEIKENDYDLSINRYKEIVYEEVQYDEPKVILNRVKELETSILKGIEELEGMIG